jgi:hypothetical protein
VNLQNVVVNARALGQIAAAVSPWVPTRGASDSASVTAQWLTQHLGESVGAVALSAEPLDGTSGTTDRRRVAVVWDQAGVDAGLPANVFVKSSPLNAKNRVMVGALDMAVNEVRFYQQASAELEGIVPKAWFTYAGLGARFLIVLDDLAVQGAKPYALADRCELEHARGLMDAFARLHSNFWESPAFRGICPGSAPGVPAPAIWS